MSDTKTLPYVSVRGICEQHKQTCCCLQWKIHGVIQNYGKNFFCKHYSVRMKVQIVGSEFCRTKEPTPFEWFIWMNNTTRVTLIFWYKCVKIVQINILKPWDFFCKDELQNVEDCTTIIPKWQIFPRLLFLRR